MWPTVGQRSPRHTRDREGRRVAIPTSVISMYVRATSRNRPYVSESGAHALIRELKLRPVSPAPPQKMPFSVKLSVVQKQGWLLYKVTPTRHTPRGAVVYAHGGGWVREIVKQHWHFVAQIAAEADTTVLVPIYPLVPWGTAVKVRDHIVALVLKALDRYQSVSLVGDSAGGQIVLSTGLELRDRGHRIPRTALISPALDLTWSNPLIEEVQPFDPWLGVPGGRVLAEAWRGDLPIVDPAVSPIFGDFAGLGPISIYTGTRDILNPDAHVLHDRLQQAGVESELYEADGQLHVYPLLPTTEGASARRRIIDDLRRSCKAGL